MLKVTIEGSCQTYGTAKISYEDDISVCHGDEVIKRINALFDKSVKAFHSAMSGKFPKDKE